MRRDEKGHLQPGETISGYTITRVLGAGGFGVTYAAENLLGRKVAIKEFLVRLGVHSGTLVPEHQKILDWALRRFEETAKELAKLSHANIVKVEHYIPVEGSGFMIMELVEGRTLADVFKEKGPMPLEALRPLLAPVMDALEYLHGQGKVHRDVAPDNVMVRADGTPVLIDFGALKAIEEELNASEVRLGVSRILTRSSFAVMKPYYTPPEQANPKAKLTPAADVYALAATLHCGLLGKPPMDAGERAATLVEQGADPRVPLATTRPAGVSADLCTVLDRALSLAVAVRPATITVLRNAVGWGQVPAGIVEPEPATPPPPEPVQHKGKPKPKSLSAWYVSAAASLALLIGGSVWWSGETARRAEIQAARDRAIAADLRQREIDADRAREQQAREESARAEAARQEAARLEAAREEAARQEARLQAAREEAARQEARLQAARQDAARQEAARLQAAREEAVRQEAARLQAAREDAARQEAARLQAAREDAARQEAARLQAAREEAARQEAARLQAAREEAARQEARLQAAREEAARHEARLQALREETLRQRIRFVCNSRSPISNLRPSAGAQSEPVLLALPNNTRVIPTALTSDLCVPSLAFLWT
jgi:serine/threonine protein kinase